jgi:hypothetical protein
VPNAKLQGVAGDLGTRAGVDQFVKSVPNTDILVNNLGIFGPGDLFSSSDEDWERYFQINLMSGVRLTRAYLQGMMDRKWGRVVFLSSESGLNVPPDMLAYGFSKTAQVSIARGIAKLAAGAETERIRSCNAWIVYYPARGEHGRSGQHGRVCVLDASVRDDGRRIARGRRYCGFDCVVNCARVSPTFISRATLKLRSIPP